MESPFSIEESIRFGWLKLRAHNSLIFKVTLTVLLVQIGGTAAVKMLEHSPFVGAAHLLLFIIEAFVGVGATVISLKLVRGAAAQYHDLVPPGKLVWRCLLSGFCSGAVILLPMLLAAGFFGVVLVSLGVTHIGWVHGRDLLYWLPLFVALAGVAAAALSFVVYFALRLSMVRYAILDGAHVVESLEKSSRITRGVKGKLLLFVGVLVCLNILGLLAFIVGLLVTIPVSALAFAHVYTILNGRIEPPVQK